MGRRMRKLMALFGTTALIISSVAGCSSDKGKSSQENSGTTTNSTANSGSESSGASTDSGSESSGDTGETAEALDTSSMFTSRDMETGYDESESTEITLSDQGSKAESDAVKVDGSTVTISKEGVYVLSGKLSKGQILVEAEDTAKVQLVLKGAEITNEDSAAIYVKEADKVFVTSDEGTENTLSTAGAFAADGDTKVDGVIYAKCDLTLNGKGSLTVDSVQGSAVVSKDDLKLTGGTYTISAKKHGLEGKDSVRVADGKVNITCEEDGIHSDNSDNTEKGYVYVAGGNVTMAVGDDGVHASSRIQIDNGTINITKSNEGIEGQNITINDGTIDVVSSDDGFNASSGGSGTDATDVAAQNQATGDTQSADASDGDDRRGRGHGGFGGGGDPMAGDSSCSLTINGGKINVNADGDGLDSNGALLVNGGEIYVSGPTNNGNGALDSGTEATITGGILVAAGASGMAENFGTNSTQCAMLVTFEGSENGSAITLKDSSGKELVSYKALKSYNSVVISTPDIKKGETYTVTCGSTETTVEMTDTIYGESNGMGGFGGHGQGAMGPRGDVDGQKGLENGDKGPRKDADGRDSAMGGERREGRRGMGRPRDRNDGQGRSGEQENSSI